MPIRSILLRLFLIVVLLLNGTATAVESVHMNPSGMGEAMSQVPAHATPDGKMPCHDAEAKTTSDVAPPAATGLHTSSDVSVSTDDGTSLPDCCESGACRCACLHHGQFAPMTMVASAAIIGHTDSVRPMFSVHASPALPHLIRPPIG